MVNLAHGDLGILAAFVALFLLDSFDLGVFWASLASIVIMFGIGYVLQRGLLNFTIGPDDTRPIVVTFGLSIIIQNGLVMWFSADSQGLDAGAHRERQHPAHGPARGRLVPADRVRASPSWSSPRSSCSSTGPSSAAPSGPPPTTRKRPS